MNKLKIIAPNVFLDKEQYIFYDFGNGLELTNSETVDTVENCVDKTDEFKIGLKKDKMFFESVYGFCPHCGKRHIHKHGETTRKLYFKDLGKKEVIIQRYKCQNCGKTFQTNLDDIVESNANYTLEVKELTNYFTIQFLASINNVRDFFNKEFNLNFSKQTVIDWLLKEDLKIEESSEYYSGYYIFDIQHIKRNGQWIYCHSLLDAISHICLANELYDEQSEKNVEEFLNENLRNKNVEAITTDLEPKFIIPIRKLGLKHQYCLVHARKNINKKVRDLCKNQINSDELMKESFEQLKPIKEMFKASDYDEANEFFSNLYFKLNEFNSVVQKVLKENILPRYKSFIHYIKNPKIAFTTNPIENKFAKTLAKTFKRIFKSEEGIEQRVNGRSEIWNDRRKINMNPQSF